MDDSTALNLGIALLALVLSTGVAVRQFLVARGANYLEVSWQVLKETTAKDFLGSEEYIATRLSLENEPARGISGLSEPARSHVRRVAYAYQTIGYLAALRVIDRRMVRYLVGLRVVRAWRSMSSFVEAERRLDSDGVGFRFFEDLASRCVNLTPAEAVRQYRLRTFAPSTDGRM